MCISFILWIQICIWKFNEAHKSLIKGNIKFIGHRHGIAYYPWILTNGAKTICIWWPFFLAVGSVNSWRLSIMNTPPICLGSRYSWNIGTGVALKVVLLQALNTLKHQLIIYVCSEMNVRVITLGLQWPASFCVVGMGEFLSITNKVNYLPKITWLPTCYH